MCMYVYVCALSVTQEGYRSDMRLPHSASLNHISHPSSTMMMATLPAHAARRAAPSISIHAPTQCVRIVKSHALIRPSFVNHAV